MIKNSRTVETCTPAKQTMTNFQDVHLIFFRDQQRVETKLYVCIVPVGVWTHTHVSGVTGAEPVSKEQRRPWRRRTCLM